MSVMEDALRRALGQMTNDGGATVWAPQVTTGQAARLAHLQQVAARALGGDGRTYAEADWAVNYQANAGVTPDADDPAFTAYLEGAATGTVSSGLLTITA